MYAATPAGLVLPGQEVFMVLRIGILAVAALALAACGSGWRELGEELPPPGAEPEIAEAACQPDCEGRHCGDDGCGGQCGNCFDFGGALNNGLCRADGSCCQQECTGRLCGDDGCGGSCGSCRAYGECVAGECRYTPGWTVLIWAMGDNDLEGSMLGQLNQLMTVGSSEHLNIVVQIDYVGGMAGRPGNWREQDLTAGQRLLIKEGEVEVLEELPEFDSSSPKELAAFIEWGIATFPARRYALILDDHGSGYQGLGHDGSSNGWMELPELAEGLAAGLSGSGIDSFDLLFFYACLMGSYEVAHAVQPYARLMMASSEIAIGASFRLDRLTLVRDDPEVDGESLALALMEDYVPTWAAAYPNVTVSLTDLEALPSFEAALQELLSAFEGKLGEVVGEIMIARFLAEKFAWLPYEWASMHLVDLGGLLQGLLLGRPDLEATLGPVLTAYDQMVLANFAGPGHAGATGLSVFFPPRPEYYDQVNEWRGTTPGEEYESINPPTGWHDFLMAVLEVVTVADLGPTFACSDIDEEAEICSSQQWVVEGEEQLIFSYPLNPESLADGFQASMIFGEMAMSSTSARIDFYTTFPAEIDPVTGIVTGSFDYRRLVLRQGKKESNAYWSLSGEGSELTAPIFYMAPGAASLQSGEWRATIDPGDGSVVASSLWVRDAAGLFVPLEPAAGSKLYPAVHRMDLEWYLYDWQPLYTAFDPFEPLVVSFEPVTPCKGYLYGLFVQDEVGRNDIVVANRCKAEGVPSYGATVTVETAGPWDDDSLPDLAATLIVDGQPFTWETVPDSATATFETSVDKVRDRVFKLQVFEVDEGKDEELVDKDASKYFLQSDSICQRTKSWNQGEQPTEKKFTVTLTVDKCR